jgi:hypothetical protein
LFISSNSIDYGINREDPNYNIEDDKSYPRWAQKRCLGFNTKIGNKQRKDPVPMRESSLKDQLDSDTVTKIDARITKITKSFKTFGLHQIK